MERSKREPIERKYILESVKKWKNEEIHKIYCKRRVKIRRQGMEF